MSQFPILWDHKIIVETATDHIIVQGTAGPPPAPVIIPPITEWPVGRAPRYASAFTQSGNVMYFIGGQLSNNAFQNASDSYNLATGVWTTLPNTPQNYMAGAAFVDPADGAVRYVTGYYQSNTYVQGAMKNTGASWVEDATNTYCGGGYGIGTYYNKVALYSHEGHLKINVIRGVDQHGLTRWSDRVYDLTTKTWTDAPSSFPIPGYNHEVVSDGTNLYASGGVNDYYTIRKFNGSTWSLVYTSPVTMSARKAIYHAGAIYYFGGYSGGYLNDVLKFDIATSSMSTLLSGTGPWAGQVGYLGYYAGGIFGMGLGAINAVSTKIFRYSIADNTWTLSS